MEQITVYVPTEKDIIEDNVFRVVSIGNAESKQGYFFTPEELEELIGKAFDAGVYRGLYRNHPNKEQYIKNLKQQ